MAKTACKRITFTAPTGRKVKVTRCEGRKLSDSAGKRFAREGACRADGRFVRCDSESPAPAHVRKAEAQAARAAAKADRALTGKVCFRTKADMLRAFKDANQHVMQRCEPDTSGQSFDPINHPYDRSGKRKVTDCDQAVRVASPTSAPYCMDRIDFDALNNLSVAKRNGGFRLPPKAQDAITELEARRRYAEDEDDPYGPRPSELEGLKRRKRRR